VITFLIVAGLLVAGALLMVVPPLLGRGRDASVTPAAADAEQAATAMLVLREQLADLDAERAAGGVDDATYARSRDELERRALDEGKVMAPGASARPARVWAVLVGLGVPVMAAMIYLSVGTPDALDPQKVAGQQTFSPEQIREMVGTLEARLEKEPDNVEGWAMLARSWLVLEDYPEASKAYARLAELIPDNADVVADWADVVATKNGSIVGEAEALVARALEIDPNHVKSLALAGTAAYQRGDFAAAATLWERILSRVPPGQEIEGQLRDSINDARGRAGMPALAASAGQQMPPVQAVANGEGAADSVLKIAGRLDVAPALRDQVLADDTVFVFVRGGAGGPPIAALRFKGSELPLDFTFDGVPRMSGNAPLPEKLALAVRVSKSGDVMAKPGDLEGRIDGLSADASGVALTIEKVRE
jgi:cytochrome c-type biogenesis protein CcmH